MENPANLSDEELQEILERSHGSQGQKVLIQEEQKARLAERITELEALRDEQSERIAELEEEIGKELEELADWWRDLYTSACQCTETAEVENVKLREALLKYGHHSGKCALLTMDYQECDCDFDVALAKGDKK